MKLFYNFLSFLILSAYCLSAQKAENPWALSVGADLVNVLDDVSGKSPNSFSVPALGISRHLNKGVSIGVQYTPTLIGKNDNNLTHTAIDGFIKWNLSKKIFVPYIFTGYGITLFSDTMKDLKGTFPSTETSKTYLGGVGVNYFLENNLAINYSSSYRSSAEEGSYNHLQHIIGLSYHFGVSDSDKDGINDKKDICPDLPGLIELKGCPDSDGDGIPDYKDACPQAPGTEINLGCPDTDGDGITDNKDACPKRMGTFETQGCPDQDGDTVPNNRDKCPKIPGKPNNQGCPELKKDSNNIKNKEVTFAKEAVQKTAIEYQESASELDQFLISDQSKIIFLINSYRLDLKAQKALLKLKRLMKKYPRTNINIEGHASNDGIWIYNMKLSEKRAKEVKKYLISNGINGTRIRTVWFGEDRPIENNATPKGKQKNRRVKIN